MRKRANDYLREFNDIESKYISIKNRIKQRAKFLCNKFPHVYLVEEHLTAKQFIEDEQYHSTRSYIHVIDIIEKENEKNSKIKQGNLFEN